MPIDVFANFAQTSLTTAVTTTPAAGTVETWTVASTASFPQIGTSQTEQFRVTCGPSTDTSPEIVIVQEVLSSTQISVERGAENSTVKTHAAGTSLYHTVTTGSLDTFRFLTQTVTSSQNVTAPIWATVADVTLIGGGGGGGGGGSANGSANSPVSAQTGGASGSIAPVIKATVSVTGGTVYPITIGAGGTGGTGGAAASGTTGTGSPGGDGNGGGASSAFGLTGAAGGPGWGSYANSNNPQGALAPVGCQYVTGGTIDGQFVEGNGSSVAAWHAANSSTAGSAANATNGGPGGQVPANRGNFVTAYSNNGTMPGANGGNGATPTDYGLAGAGGGGGAPGGAGGNGGNGAPGVCIITWRSQ